MIVKENNNTKYVKSKCRQGRYVRFQRFEWEPKVNKQFLNYLKKKQKRKTTKIGSGMVFQFFLLWQIRRFREEIKRRRVTLCIRICREFEMKLYTCHGMAAILNDNYDGHHTCRDE